MGIGFGAVVGLGYSVRNTEHRKSGSLFVLCRYLSLTCMSGGW